MLVLLSEPLSIEELPSPLAVYTHPDFMDRVNKNSLVDSGFFEPVFFPRGPHLTTGVGWGGTTDVKKNFQPETIAFDSNKAGSFEIGIPIPIPFVNRSAPGIWINDEIDVIAIAGRILLDEGDSGGPLVFMQKGTQPTIFGVASLSSPFGIVTNGWSPTWDNGRNNGKFIRDFLAAFVDEDEDGVADISDNCPPARCQFLGHCRNPGQEDQDGDGVGDQCDNCPPLACLGNDQQCINPNQNDFDRDGIGDVCDACPELTGAFVGAPDGDGDRVPDACDSCPTVFNSRPACQANCPGGGFCILPPILGGSCGGTARACGDLFLAVPSCPAGALCAQQGSFGVCSTQGDPDQDQDGVGDACDICSGKALQLNSNPPAETREGASPVGDACEDTPLFTVRETVAPVGTPDPGVRTFFTAWAGVGAASGVTHAAFTGAPVGFRHCDCRLPPAGAGFVDLDFENCLAQRCFSNRAEFDILSNPRWRSITAGFSPPGQFSQATISSETLDPLLAPTYTGGIDCSLFLLTRADPRETSQCRVGTGRLMSWPHLADIQAGRIGGTPISAYTPPDQVGLMPSDQFTTWGLLWSHGLAPVPLISGGPRDAAFAGRLRDHYVQVQTPSRLAFAGVPTPRVVLPTLSGCRTNPLDPQCYKVVNPDWQAPRIAPCKTATPFEQVGKPVIIFPQNASSLVAIHRSVEPNFALGTTLSNLAAAALFDSARMLIVPSEPSPRSDALAGGILGISISRSWSQFGSRIEGIGQTAGCPGQIDRTFQGPDPSEPSGDFVPSDRVGARVIYSALEQSVYLIGGRRDGLQTSEIWRFDMVTGDWRHLFVPVGTMPVMVGDVAAVAYDSSAGKLLIVDDSGESTGRTARLAVFDTRAEISRVAALADLRAFKKVGLAVTGDGRFVLTGAKFDGTNDTWSAYRLRVTSENLIVWEGKKTGTGMLVADPVAWRDGPGIFVQTGGDVDAIDLPKGAFTPSGAPPEISVCDSPPVVSAPPSTTITACTGVNLGMPVVTSSCGRLAVTNNAPRIFKLGQTAVTWTFADALGNVVTKQQTVTAVLGDDATCCPVGTNVIAGTSNNDALTGTSGNDCILGRGAQDTINGLGGNDYISGGEGDDVIDGGSGDDQIYGGNGQDRLKGGTGKDIVEAGGGDDQCWGGDDDDVIRGGDGQDKLYGENGNDQIFGDAGDDRLEGGSGNDMLDGGINNDMCSGGSGSNQILRCESAF